MTELMIVGEAWGKVELTQGYFALVDAEDYERINQFNWCAIVRPSGLVHAMRKIGRTETVWMHHDVLQRVPALFEIDHRNKNGIDNRKFNLRLATRSQNVCNTDRVQTAKLIEQHGNRFRARIMRNGVRTTIGSFTTELEAIKAVEDYRVNNDCR